MSIGRENNQMLNEEKKVRSSSGDRRIKVYDYMPYENRQPGTIDIIWPLSSYSILIPGSNKGSENILEHIVYRMLKVKDGDIEATSKILCLEKDLVEFIVSKLREQGFIGDDNRVKEESENPASTYEGTDSYISVKVFRDLSDEKKYILPFVVVNDDVSVKNVKRQYQDRVEYAYDNEESKIISAYIVPTKGVVSNEIDSKDIIQAVKDYLKSYRNNFNDPFEKKKKVLERIINENFIILPTPEKVYLHLSASIETNMYDVMISDFQGNGYYFELSKKMNSRLISRDENEEKSYAWCVDFRNSKLNNSNMYSNSMKQYSNFFSYDSNRYFKDALLNRDNLKGTVDTIKRINEKEKTIHKIINYLYRSIECALSELYKLYCNDVLISAIPFDKKYACKGLVKKISDKYSLNLVEEEQCFFKISPYIFKNIEQQPEMQCLLFLNLFESNYSSDHPFLRIFKRELLNNPISFIIGLKKYRDLYSHESNADILDLEKVDGFIEKTRLLLETLAPISQNSNIEEMCVSDNKVDLFKSDDYVVRARIFLDEKMGHGFLQNINQNDAERVLNQTKRYFFVEGTKIDNERKKYLSDYFDEMYKCFEGMFLNKVRRCRKTIEEIDKFIKYDLLDVYGVNLSQNSALATVRKQGVQNCLHGSGFSLTAITIALLISSDESLIKSFLEHCGSYKVNFIDFIERVILYRGHGSNVNIDLSNDELNEINKNFLFIFKSFVEFFK